MWEGAACAAGAMPARGGCTKCGRQPALLGKKPNKYCYRVECKQAGVTAGHIVPAGARRAGGDAAAVLQPVQMRGDADAQARSAEAEVFEIKETLGIRYAPTPYAHALDLCALSSLVWLRGTVGLPSPRR